MLTEDSHLTVAVKGDWLKSRVREIRTHGSVRGVKFFYKAEYCGTPQSKERRNREYKACLNERTLRLLDQFADTRIGIYSYLKGCYGNITAWLARKTKPIYSYCVLRDARGQKLDSASSAE